MDYLTIHPKAPTQVTCAHCQRSFIPPDPVLPDSSAQTFRPGSRALYEAFEGGQHLRQKILFGDELHFREAAFAELKQMFVASLEGRL